MGETATLIVKVGPGLVHYPATSRNGIASCAAGPAAGSFVIIGRLDAPAY